MYHCFIFLGWYSLSPLVRHSGGPEKEVQWCQYETRLEVWFWMVWDPGIQVSNVTQQLCRCFIVQHDVHSSQCVFENIYHSRCTDFDIWGKRKVHVVQHNGWKKQYVMAVMGIWKSRRGDAFYAGRKKKKRVCWNVEQHKDGERNSWATGARGWMRELHTCNWRAELRNWVLFCIRLHVSGKSRWGKYSWCWQGNRKDWYKGREVK